VLAVIYKADVDYAKAGVMLLGLCQHHEVQLDLFAESDEERQTAAHSDSKGMHRSAQKTAAIISVMDELNKKFGQNNQQQAAVFIASEGIKDRQNWQMSRAMLSPCYTTDITQLPKTH